MLLSLRSSLPSFTLSASPYKGKVNCADAKLLHQNGPIDRPLPVTNTIHSVINGPDISVGASTGTVNQFWQKEGRETSAQSNCDRAKDHRIIRKKTERVGQTQTTRTNVHLQDVEEGNNRG